MSSDFVPFPPPAPVEGLYLVGFRLDPGAEGPQFYTLFALEGENERPLRTNGRVLFFSRPEDAARALSASDNDMQRLGPPPQELEMLVDVAQALYLANSAASDTDGVLLDVIGCFDDLVRSAGINAPAEYMSVLGGLSERLVSNPEFATWLTEQGIDRERIEDAIMWCVGAVAVKSSWVG
ncbi:MAG TPA: hypothetical protein VEG32_13025 [Clostridia bacterium]|nr:hypothetical protein [Clostridia bacterium]